MLYSDALKNIYPIQMELKTVITKDHLIDDYVLSRNIAKYGLHVKTLMQLQLELGDNGNYLWHQYTITIEDKISQMREILKGWGVNG